MYRKIPQKKSRQRNRNMNNYSQLEKRLNYTFTNKQLIIEALTHKSDKKPYNNERLEFLGDAVLDLIVGEYLFSKFPNSDEGILSKIRASLVNESGFTLLAREINLGEYIYLSMAEENNNGRDKPSLLSNAFEAVIGAVYLEAGLETAKNISINLLEECHPKIDLQSLSKDYKTALQELTQATHGVTPLYEMIGSSGPDHKKEFEIAIILDEKTIAIARGKSKKDAQQKAAKIALEKLKG
jgi:ribonuclease-3